MESISKEGQPSTTPSYWGYRELNADEVLMVTGGNENDGGEGFAGGFDSGYGGGGYAYGGDGEVSGTLSTVTVNGGPSGFSPSEGAGWGSLAGTAAALGYVVRGGGGAAAAGDLMAAGAALGSVAGAWAAIVGIIGMSAINSNFSGPAVGNPMGDYQGFGGN